jgi:thymidine phosphorylase
MATREIGLQVIALGGGRRVASDAVDARVGFSQVAQRGQRVEAGDVLAWVHASNEAAADAAQGNFLALIEFGEEPLKLSPALMIERLGEIKACRASKLSE